MNNKELGPYDEVIWIPGYFEVPQTGRQMVRISRIYVSSIESVFNGELKQCYCMLISCLSDLRTTKLEYP